jgi:tetratricopeptide (TPR) repeat protein
VGSDVGVGNPQMAGERQDSQRAFRSGQTETVGVAPLPSDAVPPRSAALRDLGVRTTAIEETPTKRSPTRLTDLALGDRSVGFVTALALAWVALVAVPLALSILTNRSAHGIPLVCVVAWVALLRVARWLSPPRRCDGLLERGLYREALTICERELSVPGDRAWRGSRRLAWLNRTTNALVGLGRFGEASVAAVEALKERHDPETVGNLGLCLLYLERYEEAAQAARQALDLTRERSVVAHAILGAVHVRDGRPAEAQAAADAGLADVEVLLPFARTAHHVALLATRCQADRMLRNVPQAERDLSAMRKVAGRNDVLQSNVYLEQADMASSLGNSTDALVALRRAIALAPHAACWYASQPHTFQELRGIPTFDAALVEAREAWSQRTGLAEPERGAAPPAYIAGEIAAAPERAHARPARHASWRALVVQGATLAGTLALLIWWTWHFFLTPG